MKLIIDIPEEKYKTIQEGMYCGMLDADLYRDIKNGIPLEQIRAEIEQLTSRYSISKERGSMGQVEWSDRLIKESDVLQIIDNYREGELE